MIDRAYDWAGLCHAVGPCIRPGGINLTERALTICKLPEGAAIVDIGCGTGWTLEYLAETGSYRTVGLDCSDALIMAAASRTVPLRLIRGRAERLPFKDNLFDALFCECVLSVVDDQTVALSEYFRVLKGGGFLIISDVFWNREQECREESREPAMKEFLEKGRMVGFIEGLGFSLMLWEEHKRFLNEFAARLILTRGCFPDPWKCLKGRKDDRDTRGKISYFLLVAKKQGVNDTGS